jgi:SAM-dependent methyltransferase
LSNIHQESFLKLEELSDTSSPYLATFDFPEDFINQSHRWFSTCPIRDGILIEIKDRPRDGAVIEGWLRREDALKLYEIAYFVSGDILELGSYHGLSTSILSRANHDGPYEKSIYSVDLDPANGEITNQHLRAMGLGGGVTTICGDAASVVRGFAAAGKKFEFVFIDHSHAYDPVYAVCRELGSVLMNGGFCLFHDFNDARNRDSSDKDYGVYQAVIDGLDPNEFEFYGVYGCAALYRFKKR